jgi:hypothetical protein
VDLKSHLVGQPAALHTRVWRCLTLAFQLCDPKPSPLTAPHQQQQSAAAHANKQQTLQRPGQKPAPPKPTDRIDSGSDDSDEEGNTSPSPHPHSLSASQGRVATADWLGALLFLARAPFAQKLTLAFSLADLDAQDALTAPQLINMVGRLLAHTLFYFLNAVITHPYSHALRALLWPSFVEWQSRCFRFMIRSWTRNHYNLCRQGVIISLLTFPLYVCLWHGSHVTFLLC